MCGEIADVNFIEYSRPELERVRKTWNDVDYSARYSISEVRQDIRDLVATQSRGANPGWGYHIVKELSQSNGEIMKLWKQYYYGWKQGVIGDATAWKRIRDLYFQAKNTTKFGVE
jgi:hypothetical protein